jgi:hypothetical protein
LRSTKAVRRAGKSREVGEVSIIEREVVGEEIARMEARIKVLVQQLDVLKATIA